MNRVSRLPIAVTAVLLAAGLAVAQDTTGAISGAVRAPDGALLPQVTITIESPETGLSRAPCSRKHPGKSRCNRPNLGCCLSNCTPPLFGRF